MKLPRNTLRRRILEVLAASQDPLDTTAIAATMSRHKAPVVRASMRHLVAQNLIVVAGHRQVTIKAGGGLRPVHSKTLLCPAYRITPIGRQWLDHMPDPGGAEPSPAPPRHDHTALAEAWR